jgi:hypothetical protein
MNAPVSSTAISDVAEVDTSIDPRLAFLAGSGHDIDIYAFGREAAPPNYADPLVLLPWRVWARLLERVRR